MKKILIILISLFISIIFTTLFTTAAYGKKSKRTRTKKPSNQEYSVSLMTPGPNILLLQVPVFVSVGKKISESLTVEVEAGQISYMHQKATKYGVRTKYFFGKSFHTIQGISLVSYKTRSHSQITDEEIVTVDEKEYQTLGLEVGFGSKFKSSEHYYWGFEWLNVYAPIADIKGNGNSSILGSRAISLLFGWDM